MSHRSGPVFAPDFWSDAVILDPYPHYDMLRSAGPAVWLAANDAWALTQYETVRAALLDAATFSSASGCMVNEPMNSATQGIMLCSDDPEHLGMRRLFARPLQPKALAELRPRFETLAAAKVDATLLSGGTFDAVRDLAHFLPLAVVTELVGLDDEGRASMLTWAAGIFDAFGPLSSSANPHRPRHRAAGHRLRARAGEARQSRARWLGRGAVPRRRPRRDQRDNRPHDAGRLSDAVARHDDQRHECRHRVVRQQS